MIGTNFMMRLYAEILCLALIATVITSAIPKPETEEETVKNKHLNRPYDKVCYGLCLNVLFSFVLWVMILTYFNKLHCKKTSFFL